MFGVRPRPSNTSISPDKGHEPYTESFESIHIAGHTPVPIGIFALKSTLPYLTENLSFVVILPEEYFASAFLEESFFCVNIFDCFFILIFNLPSFTDTLSLV